MDGPVKLAEFHKRDAEAETMAALLDQAGYVASTIDLGSGS
jgi:hypothetical protein